jgi:hypothetical protein
MTMAKKTKADKRERVCGRKFPHLRATPSGGREACPVKKKRKKTLTWAQASSKIEAALGATPGLLGRTFGGRR